MDVKQVVAIRDVIPPSVRQEFTDVYIATELMDTDLHQIIRSNQGLSEEHCQVSTTFFFFFLLSYFSLFICLQSMFFFFFFTLTVNYVLGNCSAVLLVSDP